MQKKELATEPKSKSMIRVKGLSKYYDQFHALREVSFEVGNGEIVGFLGPNGAGKSTTMKILTGYMPPSSGAAEINELDVEKSSLEVRRQVGYLPESNPLYTDFTVDEFLHYVCDIRHIPRTERESAIRRVVKDCSLEKVYYKQIDMLSKGYRQRVGLAQALIHNPSVLILDEPTVGLDPKQIVEIRDLIKKIGKNKTVLLSTHLMQEVQALCDRVIILNKGKIVATGSPSELQQQTSGQMLATLYVKVAGTIKEVETILKDIKGVQRVTKKDEEKKGLYGYEVLHDHKKDLRSDIFKAIHQNKLELYELTPRSINMENVFIELTKK